MDASEQTSLFDLNANFTNPSEKDVCCNERNRERDVRLSSDVSVNKVSPCSPKG